MNKIVSFIKKNYIYINITILLLTIYIILFPIIETPIQKIFPNFNKCTYLRVTGKPCPLCGGTRYIRNLSQALQDITYLFHPFGVIMLFVFGELVFRAYNIFKFIRKKEISKRYVEIDLNVLLIALISFTIYEIVFIIMN